MTEVPVRWAGSSSTSSSSATAA